MAIVIVLPAAIVSVVPEVVVATLRRELIVCVVQLAVPAVLDSPMLMFWATVKVWAVFVAVAAALMVIVPVPMVTIVAPAGMPGPLIAAPTTRPVVLATVTVVLPSVVAPAVSVWA